MYASSLVLCHRHTGEIWNSREQVYQDKLLLEYLLLQSDDAIKDCQCGGRIHCRDPFNVLLGQVGPPLGVNTGPSSSVEYPKRQFDLYGVVHRLFQQWLVIDVIQNVSAF